MPLTRYQIRNEFNLADPDLYRASDKDDPEALLEGVAMAGLVGVLRQLGDLAEFAAEIFHDLHEEVMATAARGHGLTARIQQLETDVPLIEKNLLSLTDHTSFYYNRGIDWHPQMCTDQNLITQGDMPRFIRDSYEECRGPPQLFLLDKFDVGGAGACLKRYTDPSSFKAEPTTSDAVKLEGQRDRRTRKIKRKGTHWRNRDTPEVLTTSHAKLHQLLIEERIGNDSRVPARHVKLKKRTLDGSKSSKSYMEKFLQSMSPEHSESHETEVGQPTLRLTYNHIDDSVHEILDIQPVSAAEDSLNFSPTDQETKLRPTAMSSYDFSKSRRSKGSAVSVEDGNYIGTASPLRVPVAEKELGVYGENRHINGITSLHSDDMASETENYMDAVANMESEAETDNEYNPKKELRYFSKPREQVLMVRDRLFDSHSVENSITSDDGSMSFMKVTSTSSLHGAPHNEEHGDREAESSLSMSACDALHVDYKHSFDYDETKKSTSNWYLNSNGRNVGSSATSFDSAGGDISFVKESSHLLQSSESGSNLRHLYLTSAEGIYDSECPQGDRSRLNGDDDTTPDDSCKDDNVSVIQTSIEGHEPKASSEVLAHFSNDLSHDHFKRSSMLKNGTSQNVYIDEFLSDDLADNEVESPRSATDTQLRAFDQGHRNGDSRSNLVLPGDDHVGTYHTIYSKYVNDRFSSEKVPDGSNHAMDSTREMYGSFLAENDATNLLEINANDDSRFIATQKEFAVTKLLADGHDSEGHISFEQSDSLERQASDRIHADNVTNSTNLRVKDQNPELDHFPTHFDASSFPSSNHELLFYQEAVPKVSNPQCRQISISDEVPEVDFSTQDNSLKLEGEEVIFPKDSTSVDLQTETKVNVEGAPPLPPLPPIQWIAGKPHDSFPDSDRESEEHIMTSNGSLPSFGFGLKGSFHVTPVDEDIKQPLKATQTDENLTQISSLYPGRFPLTDSTQKLSDTIDVHEQHRLLTSGTDSYIDNPRTYLQNGQSEPLSFSAETPQPSSGTYLHASLTDIDASTTVAVQASDDGQFSVPMLGEMTTHAKENIQPRPAANAVLSAAETAEPSASLESLQPTLGDSIMNVSDASEVPETSADKSPEESTSYSRTEHAARSVDEKIINQLEELGLQNENEEHYTQQMKSYERQATWSLALLNYEDEKLAQKPAVKPPRPRNPLIDSVDALDRSKLKKVTLRKQPEKPTVDERGSLLEQIRTKSFNLKPAPAPVPKPNIQAPTMNLKVAAILEKANKIRRATAGSDEDEDEWSDD